MGLIGEIDMTFEEFKKEWHDNSSFIECHTSGSTGKPSLISLSKKIMRESAIRTNTFFDIRPDSLLYSCIAPDYIGGKMMLVRSIMADCAFQYETPSNRPLINFHGNNITLLSVVPSQMAFILDHPEIYSKVKYFLIGGASIPGTIRNRIIEHGLNAFESYGMTETTSHIALRKIEKDAKWFHTLNDITVFLHSDRQLGISIKDKSVLTNDIAELKSEYEFKILGRVDNVINSGGKKISPEDVETRLSKILDFPFCISSRPDSKWGERVVLVTPENKMNPTIIIERCREVLQGYEMPKEVIFVDSLPLTPNGKIRRNCIFEKKEKE
ncbi:MAG: AMP-binding protein [Muribaculaceae bacterium]|nr:AMP-binding protein [Muribaculaceae bacterium]